MELKYKKEKWFKLDTKRKKVIKEYLELQEVYQKLYNRCLVNKFVLFTERFQEETDIGNLSKDQEKVIAKYDKLREEKKYNEIHKKEEVEFIKTLPKHEVRYQDDKLLIAPYYIGDAVEKKDSCIDNQETEIIELINERTELEIKDYKEFIK